MHRRLSFVLSMFLAGVYPAAAGPSDGYVLFIDGVDDNLSCTLNGASVGPAVGYGKTALYDLHPQSGHNVLVCTDTDDQPPSGPCWAYSYQLLHNHQTIAKISTECCTPAGGTPYVCDVPYPTKTEFTTP